MVTLPDNTHGAFHPELKDTERKAMFMSEHHGNTLRRRSVGDASSV